MVTSPKRFATAVQSLASKRLAIALFLLLCVVLILGSGMEAKLPALGWAPRILFGCMAINLLLCTMQRIKTLPWAVIAMHAGSLTVIAGATVSSFGYIATVQSYEGTVVDKAYRWDLQQDMPLGFDLLVRGINTEYYPVPVRVGVLEGDRKIGLFELKTGQSFTLGRYRVHADALEFPAESLLLTVSEGINRIGSADTSGRRDLPPGFPFDFKLVAFKNPVLKRTWVDLELSQGGSTIRTGTAEVNGPLDWQGLRLYHTKLERDAYGVPYAGIQIVKDPGMPLVYAGFLILTAGMLSWMFGKMATGRTGQRTS